MRSKTEYIIESVNGKQVPRKIGMAPIQRAGMEYEFTLVADLDIDHKIVISKSRCDAMADKVTLKPGADFWLPFAQWLNSGDAPAAKPANKETGNEASEKPMNGSPRPYPPEVLKAKILDFADQMSGNPLKGNEAQTVAMNLNECFGGNEDKRKTLLHYLTGKTSAKELDAGWLLALKKWIHVTQDAQSGKWFMDPLAVQEANAAYEAAMIAQGQMKMTEGK
jgi:hypothetical protein